MKVFKPLFLSLIVGSAMAGQADVLLNTYGTTGPGYDPGSYYFVDPNQSIGRGFLVGFGNYTFTGIDIALAFSTSTSVLNVSICSDNSGVPGAAIETFAVSNAGTLGPASRYTLNSVLHPTLAMGSSYFITMAPADANSSGGWGLTNDGHTATLAYTSGPGGGWNTASGITDGAVTVFGDLQTVPEPTSMAVLGLGALALVRRRKGK